MQTMLHRRPQLLIGLIVAFIAAITLGCGGSSGSDQPAANQEVRLRIAGEPGTLDPQLASTSEEISVVKQLYRGLFAYDQNLNVVPSIALDVPTKANGGISADGLTYTIAMRQDATWSDGKPVTADDFAYAFQRLFDPNAGAQGYYFDFYTAIAGAAEFADGTGTADGVQVKAIDPYTLQLTLVHEQPTLPVLLALWPASPLRKDVIDVHGDDWTQPGIMIGDGPFELAARTPDESITLESNPNYWNSDQPMLQKMVYKIISDDSAALIAYQNGELDMTSIPLPDANRLEGDPEQVRFAQLETSALQYNNAEAPFDSPLVRQAISRAVDRDEFVKLVEQGVGAPGTSWLPPGLPGADISIGSDLGFSADAARSLLAQAGYPGGKDFPTVKVLVGDIASNRLAAEFLQEQLKQNLGINLEIEALDENAFFDRYFSGDFQTAWSSWFADYADPENWLPQQFGTDGSFNVLHYSNPQVDDLLAQAAVELDQQKRFDLYDKAQRIVIGDQAVTPIFYPERNYLVRSSVSGLITTALDAEPGDWFVTSIRIVGSDGQAPASNPE